MVYTGTETATKLHLTFVSKIATAGLGVSRSHQISLYFAHGHSTSALHCFRLRRLTAYQSKPPKMTNFHFTPQEDNKLLNHTTAGYQNVRIPLFGVGICDLLQYCVLLSRHEQILQSLNSFLTQAALQLLRPFLFVTFHLATPCSFLQSFSNARR